MNVLDDWTRAVTQALDLDPAELDRDLILDLTKDVAHHVARPAAPLTAFLVGLAAGRDGADAESVRAAVSRITELASDYRGIGDELAEPREKGAIER